jgi:hypothetical protein
MTNSTDEYRKHLLLMESELADYGKTKLEAHASQVRKSFTAAVVDLCGLVSSPKLISTLLQLATESTKGRRDAAILTARLLAVDGILVSEQDQALPRMAVGLIEAGFPDGYKQLRLSEKRQTYEKMDAIRGLHESICHGLRVLATMPCTIAEIDSMKAEIQRAVRKDT